MATKLKFTREQILAFRRRVSALDSRLTMSPDSLRQAAWAGLQDSMPRVRLEEWERELQFLTDEQRSVERQKRIAAYLDAGHGACWLRDARIASV